MGSELIQDSYINGPMIKQLLLRDQKLGTLKVLARSSGCQYKYKIIQLSSIKVILASVLVLSDFSIGGTFRFWFQYYLVLSGTFSFFALVLFCGTYKFWYLYYLVLYGTFRFWYGHYLVFGGTF